jgi:hypothetical protein
MCVNDTLALDTLAYTMLHAAPFLSGAVPAHA